jgi:hypothetical protein
MRMAEMTEAAGRSDDRPLVTFYDGTGTDLAGRTIEQVWRFDRERLERVHDYIQRLFPTRRQSAYNTAAPVLDETTVAAFRSSPERQARLRRSLDLMLEFYGLERAEGPDDVTIAPSADLAVRGPDWWGAGNHNHLRLTRIISSLRDLGLEREAAALRAGLERVRREHPTGISERTLQYWAAAARSGE